MVPWQGDRNKGKTVHIQQIRGYVARTGLIATDRLVKKVFTRVREIFPDPFKKLEDDRAKKETGQ